MRTSLLLLLLGASVGGGACASRRHLHEDLGRSHAAVFAAQMQVARDPAQSPSNVGAGPGNRIYARHLHSFGGGDDAGGAGGGAQAFEPTVLEGGPPDQPALQFGGK